MVQLAAVLGAEAAYVEPEILQLPAGAIGACLAAEPALEPYRFYLEDIARRAPHTLSPAEETAARRRRFRSPSAPSSVYNILTNADFPYPTVTLADGRAVQRHAGRLRGPCAPARTAQDRQAVMSAYFTALGGFGRTFGTLHARQRAEGALPGPRAPLRVLARGDARRAEHSGRGLPAAGRGRQPEPADLSSLPAAAAADARRRRAALLRPLRAAGRVGEPVLHAGGGPGAHHGGDGAARRRLRRGAAPCVRRALDRPVPHARQAVRGLLGRRRVRRASVHAHQLQRQVRRHEHAGPRAGPHDAELLFEPDAAVPDGRLSALRRGGRLDVQRVAARAPHARDGDRSGGAAVAARQLPRGHPRHGVPADAVRRVRAADARAGGRGPARDGRVAGGALSRYRRSATTATTRAS